MSTLITLEGLVWRFDESRITSWWPKVQVALRRGIRALFCNVHSGPKKIGTYFTRIILERFTDLPNIVGGMLFIALLSFWTLLGSSDSLCTSLQVSTLVGAAAQSTCDTDLVSLGYPSSPESPSSAFKAWGWPLAAVPRCAGQIQVPNLPRDSRNHYFASVRFLLFIGSRHNAPSHEESCRNWQGSFASSTEAEALGTGWHNSPAPTDVWWFLDSGEGNGKKVISSDNLSMFEHLNTQSAWNK